MVLKRSISSIFVGEFLTIATSMDNKQSSKNLDCVYDNFRLVFTREVEKPLRMMLVGMLTRHVLLDEPCLLLPWQISSVALGPRHCRAL